MFCRLGTRTLYCIVLHCIALHCIALHCIALHCIALHCIALHCIALYCIVLYYICRLFISNFLLLYIYNYTQNSYQSHISSRRYVVYIQYGGGCYCTQHDVTVFPCNY